MFYTLASFYVKEMTTFDKSLSCFVILDMIRSVILIRAF
ncbi:hypothetical protein J569_2766 [Acinetobacter sp. 907131]|jgi:hypothetical protein|nr:hypothetical protein J569_2766 [Acinetobacter sp. 907131]EXG31921.1 hypothetical protein J733_1578 [Acinetobacter sp. 263903-2]EXH33092.1 hypothetical protein J623_2475 [Acinetobacter sp. 1245249]EXS34575.1 hypothetical protein J663_1508 [Acinetobacter sp. 826659]WHA51799.1 hypothetical protein OH685_00860 [Acinetobacter pittii]